MKNSLAVLAVLSLVTFTMPTLARELSNLELQPAGVILAQASSSPSPSASANVSASPSASPSTSPTTSASPSVSPTTSTRPSPVTAPVLPDLVIKSVNCNPTSPKINEGIYCSVEVYNKSSVAVATPFTVTVQERSSVTINSIEAYGLSATKTLSLINFSTSGKKELKFVVDSANAVRESNESNNTYTKVISVSGLTSPETTGPSVAVIAPNGNKGENYTIGGLGGIKFSTNGLVGKTMNVFAFNAEKNENYILTSYKIVGDGNDADAFTFPTWIPTGNYYKMRLEVVDSNNRLITDLSDDYFTIGAPTPVPTSNPSTASLSAELLSSTDDRAGVWDKFNPGAGNGNKNPADWNWKLEFKGYSSVKTVKRITIIHNSRGEIWSTGYSRYLADGTDLYGYNEHPYPLVVSGIGGGANSLNTKYDQQLNVKTDDDVNDSHQYMLYGQKENTRFTGGTIIVEFTDGTSVKTTIASSNSTEGCPPGAVFNRLTGARCEMITVLSPNGDTWVIGEKRNITWTSENIDSSTNNKVFISLVNEKSEGYYDISSVYNDGKTAYNTGSYTWIVGKTPEGYSMETNGSYWVRVCNYNRTICNKTGGKITMSSGNTAPPVTTNAKVTVTNSPTLELKYASREKEVALAATFTVAIDGGRNGVNVYANQGNIISLIDQNNTSYFVNSQRTMFTPESKLDRTTDKNGQTMYSIPAGAIAHFKVVGTVDPKELFAGTYHARLLVISTDSTKLPITPAENSTNLKTIVGEVSPYISSVTTPVAQGNKITIEGKRLFNTTGKVILLIDGAPSRIVLDGSKDGSTAFFTVPASLKIGRHSLSIKNPVTGESNRVSFEVRAGALETSATVTSSNIELTYDKSESALIAVFNVTVDAGDSDVNIPANQGNVVSFVDQNNNTAYRVNSQATVLTSISKLDSFTDKDGQEFFIVEEGEKALFRIQSIVDPKELFGGMYRATLPMIYTEDAKLEISGNNSTDVKVIVGEVSPYITSITNPVTSGQKMSVFGKRLNIRNNNEQVRFLIDGVDAGITFYQVNEGSLSFTTPSLSNGHHTLSLRNTATGESNRISFEVKGNSGNQAPIISGGTFPSVLKVGEKGTWKIEARDPENKPLSYSIVWGDEEKGASKKSSTDKAKAQSTSFTHTYMRAGVYEPTFYVTDEKGLVQQTSATVTVTDEGGTPVITFVSTATETNEGPNTNDDVGLFKIRFKVEAVGGSVFMPLSALKAIKHTVDKNGVAVPSHFFASVLSDITETDTTNAGNYEIEEGEQETFELLVHLPLGNGLTSGPYRLSITGVNWDNKDDTTPDITYISNLEEFKTNYQALN